MKKLFKGAVPTLALLLVAIMSLTSLTYAWFTAGNEATVDTVNVDVKDVEGLLVSANGYNGTWGSTLTPIFASNCNTKKLQDVSCAAELNGGVLKFFKASYNAQYDALTKATDASLIDGEFASWYQFDVFIKNDSTLNKTVNLKDTVIAGSALSRAIARLAIVYQGTASATAVLNENTAPAIGGTPSLLGIIELNAKSHTQEGEAWLKNNNQPDAVAASATVEPEENAKYMAIKSAFDYSTGTPAYVNVATGEKFTQAAAIAALTHNDYELTEDEAPDEDKTYYTRSGEGTSASPYVYTAVATPAVENIATYYEWAPNTFTSTDIAEGEYFVYTSAFTTAEGEHFTALALDNYFEVILDTTEYMDGNGFAKTGVYEKNDSGEYVLLQNGVAEIDTAKTYYKLKTTCDTVYTKSANESLEDITTNNYYYDGKDLEIDVNAGEIVKLTVFIWLEGQDCDCTNYVAGKPFTVDIKLQKVTAEPETTSGN